MHDLRPELARFVRPLGYAGMLPLAGCLAGMWLVPGGRDAMLAGGFGYAALIFSFLGGLWWGQSLTRASAPGWTWGMAVAPSLIGWGLMLAQMAGWSLRGSLVVLGVAILASPLVDLALARRWGMPRGWISLRVQLSGGLGLLTLALAAA
jgi:Protein of unknown function (DUF3429)